MLLKSPVSLFCIILPLLVASASANYIFNGFRQLYSANKPAPEPTTTTTAPIHNNLISSGFYGQDNNIKDTPMTDNNNNNNIYNNNDRRCVQTSSRDFRHVPGQCSQFVMCTGGILVTFKCPENTVFNEQVRACVPKGSRFDNCERTTEPLVSITGDELPSRPVVPQLPTLCPRGTTYKKAHPVHCARYYDCSKPAMMDHFDDHEWECKYPFLFNEDTKRCEHYSMVSCGVRKIAYDRCEYKAYTCNGHSHCRPCTVDYPSCRDLPDGMNVWQGRTPSPHYVVCSGRRVVYSGSCPGGQLFDPKTKTCVINQIY